MLMQESLVIIGIVQAIAGLVVLPIVLYLIFQREMKPFRRISEIATSIFDDFDDAQKNKIGGILDTISPIADAANNLNAVLSNEEAFDASLTILASKIRKSFVAGLLGEASGDSKRMAKADTLINTAMVDGLASINPLLGPLMESLGIKEMISEDPKMFDAIIASVFQKGGLIEMFKAQNPNIAGLGNLGNTDSLATPKPFGERGEF